MARTYNPADLALDDPKSLAWALAWARRFAADVPDGAGAWPDYSMTDEEWQGWLNATALRDQDGVVWYYPHVAAARAIQAMPNWLSKVSVGGVFQEYRTAGEAAAAILKAGRWVERLVADKGGPAHPSAEIAPRF